VKILISGAGGFLGQALVPVLLERGHAVRAMLRSKSAPPPTWAAKVETFYADLSADQLDDAFAGIDAVIHLAGATDKSDSLSTVKSTERLFETMALSGVKRLVHVSSIAVYDWTLARDVVDEDTPLRSDLDDIGEYARSKVLQEALVQSHSERHRWDVTVLRPGFIWGSGRPKIAGMGRQWARFYILFGPFTKLPLCHVSNCADLIATVVNAREVSDRIFNINDDTDVAVWRYVYEHMNRTRRFGIVIPVPYNLGLHIAKLSSFVATRFFSGRRLPSLLVPRRFEAQFKPLRFSRLKAKRVLHWHAPNDFQACLNLTYPGAQPCGKTQDQRA
jgi:nucleoside-diphosphate-sugar epimerase